MFEGASSAESDNAFMSPAVGLVVLVTLGVAACLWGMDAGPPLSDHEAIVPQCARQIRQSGQWLIPHFNRVPFIRKTPLQFWAVAGISYVSDPPDQDPPVSVLAARLPSGVAGVLTVLAVYALGRYAYGKRVGLVAGLVAGGSLGVMFYSHNAQTEMLLALFAAASMASFYRGLAEERREGLYLMGGFACMGLGMLAKGPLPIPLVGLPMVVYWGLAAPIQRAAEGSGGALIGRVFRAIVGQVFRRRTLWFIPGVLLFFAIAAPWPLYVYLKVPDAVALWRTEFFDRYEGLLSSRPKPFWYYLPLLIGLTVPFCLSLPEAIIAPFRDKYRKERAGMLFALVWVTVQVIFLSTSPFKRPHYLVPVVPGACLLLAPVIARLFLDDPAPRKSRVRLAIIALAIAMAVGLPWGVWEMHEEYPGILWMALPTCGLILIGLGICCGLFWRERRPASLMALAVTSIIGFAWVWSALGRSDVNMGEVRLAEAMRRLGIDEGDQITFAVGRPDARLGYYLGTQVQPLFTELEIATRRRGRIEVSEEILWEGIARVEALLNSEEEHYLIFEADELNSLKMMLPDIRYTEVLRVPTHPKDRSRDLVVITNTWNTGEEEDLDGDDRAPPPVFNPTSS